MFRMIKTFTIVQDLWNHIKRSTGKTQLINVIKKGCLLLSVIAINIYLLNKSLEVDKI